jgi:DNA-binding NarL/FixJ family response regulator
VVAEAEDGANAIEMVDRCNPDVVVMDVQMADMGGIEATRRILSAHPGANVVLMSMGGDQEYPALAREIGARGFLTKRNLNSEMLRSVLGVSPDDPAAAMAA